MEIKISDSIGNVLILTTNVRGVSFQAVSCSPNPSGFSVLSGLLGYQAGENWVRNACKDSIMRNEFCILPKLRSSDLRILLTPNTTVALH